MFASLLVASSTPFFVRPDPAEPPPVIPGTLSGEVPATPPPPPAPKVVIPDENVISPGTRENGTGSINVQKVLPVELPPEPVPPPPAAADPAKAAALRSLAASRPKRHILMLSGAVYDGRATHFRWQGTGPDRQFEAWPNVNFTYFRSIGSLRLPDSELVIFSLGLGKEDTARTAARRARMGLAWTLPPSRNFPARRKPIRLFSS